MSKNITVKVDASKTTGVQEHLWRWIGYDECNYTYIPEGKELLTKFSQLEEDTYYVRTHFMFCTGNCHGTYKFGSSNIYWEDADGNPVYDFEYYDKIIDAQIETGNKPFVELGFMPYALVDKAYLTNKVGNWDNYNQYKDIGWTCPPKDYDKWYGLIKAVLTHLVEKYGEEEIATWYFELWNEPDIFYWHGTVSDYCKLYDYTEAAVHAAAPTARLSGPAVTGIFEGGHAQKFFDYFLNHCKEGMNTYSGEVGTRLDFITFHVKGGGFPFEMHAPKAVPSVESLVHQVKLGLDSIVKYGYGDREVVLSEADPDGWAAGGVYDNANMIFRNTEYYASYVASTYEKIDELCTLYGIKVRPLAWAFMFPGERCFEGTRTFTTQGIDKAVFNMFKIYGKLGFEKLAFECDGAEGIDFVNRPNEVGNAKMTYTGEGEETDVSGFAVKGTDGKTQIVVYSHNNDRDVNEANEIKVVVDGLTGETAKVAHYRIDAEHSNPYAEWIRQGKPLFPCQEGEQYKAIKSRDGLEKYAEDQEVSIADGKAEICFSLPAHGVSYIEIG